MPDASYRTLIDQLGRTVRVPVQPERIISLVPSQTELLFELGVGERVVGVTKFCIHPADARTTATVIGGTKQFDFDKIAALAPDLLIGNKEENYVAGIEKLAADFPVWMSDIVTLPYALGMIRAVGELTNVSSQANELATEIAHRFEQLTNLMGAAQRALYLIWRKPWMGAGTGTFIHEMLRAAGFANILAAYARYPELPDEVIRALAPDVVFLSSEPYPFQHKHIAELRALLPAARIELVDGELFSWYGSRLLQTPAYLRELRQRVA